MYPYYNMFNNQLNFSDLEFRNAQAQAIHNDEIISLNEAIELIRKSVDDEKEDELFYDALINMSPTQKEKDIIKSIRDDEKKHNQILRELYYDFTGNFLPTSTLQMPNTDTKLDYKSLLEKALFGELDAVKKYRKILSKMPNGIPQALLMSIMTDELRHANKYNFLIATAN